jgi:hypothetical protein
MSVQHLFRPHQSKIRVPLDDLEPFLQFIQSSLLGVPLPRNELHLRQYIAAAI